MQILASFANSGRLAAVIKRRGWPGRWRTNFTGTDRLLNHPRFKKHNRVVKARRVRGLFVRRDSVRPSRDAGAHISPRG